MILPIIEGLKCPTPAALDRVSARTPPTGERFGRFVLLECIGRGGMAEVFRAVAQGVEGFQRVFVVKRIHKEKSANPALREMFVNEARISALLNHPNIVQVYDFGQHRRLLLHLDGVPARQGPAAGAAPAARRRAG